MGTREKRGTPRPISRRDEMQDQSSRDTCSDGDDRAPQPVRENAQRHHRQAGQCSYFDQANHSRIISATQALCRLAFDNVILIQVNEAVARAAANSGPFRMTVIRPIASQHPGY